MEHEARDQTCTVQPCINNRDLVDAFGTSYLPSRFCLNSSRASREEKDWADLSVFLWCLAAGGDRRRASAPNGLDVAPQPALAQPALDVASTGGFRRASARRTREGRRRRPRDPVQRLEQQLRAREGPLRERVLKLVHM